MASYSFQPTIPFATLAEAFTLGRTGDYGFSFRDKLFGSAGCINAAMANRAPSVGEAEPAGFSAQAVDSELDRCRRDCDIDGCCRLGEQLLSGMVPLGSGETLDPTQPAQSVPIEAVTFPNLWQLWQIVQTLLTLLNVRSINAGMGSAGPNG